VFKRDNRDVLGRVLIQRGSRQGRWLFYLALGLGGLYLLSIRGGSRPVCRRALPADSSMYLTEHPDWLASAGATWTWLAPLCNRVFLQEHQAEF
jgi:hypothetical protein